MRPPPASTSRNPWRWSAHSRSVRRNPGAPARCQRLAGQARRPGAKGRRRCGHRPPALRGIPGAGSAHSRTVRRDPGAPARCQRLAEQLGDLALKVDGDAAIARQHFEESLALARRILEQFGETPERLRDVSVSLDKLGDLALKVDGDAATARQHFEESLALDRRILEQFGETPERLRDVSLSLNKLGDLALKVDGDLAPELRGNPWRWLGGFSNSSARPGNGCAIYNTVTTQKTPTWHLTH